MSAAELDRYYPSRARDMEIEGRAEIECTATPTGHATDCVVLSEEPAGMGFGEATVRASRKFRVRPFSARGEPVTGQRVVIPMSWKLTGATRRTPGPPWSEEP